MNKLPPNSIKILNYLSKKYTNDPEEWVANWQVESTTMISRSNISKYTLLLVNEGLIERKYEQLGRSREVYFRFTNSKYIVKNEENGNNVFKEGFKKLLTILQEFTQTPYISYNEGRKELFNQDLQIAWVDILSRHGKKAIDKAEEMLKNE